MAGNQSLGQLGLTWFEKTQFKPEVGVDSRWRSGSESSQLTRLAEGAKQAAIAREQEKPPLNAQMN